MAFNYLPPSRSIAVSLLQRPVGLAFSVAAKQLSTLLLLSASHKHYRDDCSPVGSPLRSFLDSPANRVTELRVDAMVESGSKGLCKPAK